LNKPRLTAAQNAGVKILWRACEEPLRQIANNAGHEGSVVLDKVEQGKGAFGFNARTEIFEDLVLAGVIDPTKVVRTALENAVSVAALLLTIAAMVSDKQPGGDGEATGRDA
jgi:chaperonin GroEL